MIIIIWAGRGVVSRRIGGKVKGKYVFHGREDAAHRRKNLEYKRDLLLNKHALAMPSNAFTS